MYPNPDPSKKPSGKDDEKHKDERSVNRDVEMNSDSNDNDNVGGGDNGNNAAANAKQASCGPASEIAAIQPTTCAKLGSIVSSSNAEPSINAENPIFGKLSLGLAGIKNKPPKEQEERPKGRACSFLRRKKCTSFVPDDRNNDSAYKGNAKDKGQFKAKPGTTEPKDAWLETGTPFHPQPGPSTSSSSSAAAAASRGPQRQAFAPNTDPIEDLHTRFAALSIHDEQHYDYDYARFDASIADLMEPGASIFPYLPFHIPAVLAARLASQAALRGRGTGTGSSSRQPQAQAQAYSGGGNNRGRGQRGNNAPAGASGSADAGTGAAAGISQGPSYEFEMEFTVPNAATGDAVIWSPDDMINGGTEEEFYEFIQLQFLMGDNIDYPDAIEAAENPAEEQAPEEDEDEDDIDFGIFDD